MISKPASRSRRSPRPRTFIDEAPLIDLDAVLRTGTPDDVHLEWDQGDMREDKPFGRGRVALVQDEERSYAEISSSFHDDGMSTIYVDLTRTSNGVVGKRLRLVCPDCKSSTSKIYFSKVACKCRTCHGLLYGSQYKADVEPDFELYDRLMVESHRPRRPYERLAVYQRGIAKAKAKLVRLGDVERSRDYVIRRPPQITTSYYRGYDPE